MHQLKKSKSMQDIHNGQNIYVLNKDRIHQQPGNWKGKGSDVPRGGLNQEGGSTPKEEGGRRVGESGLDSSITGVRRCLSLLFLGSRCEFCTALAPGFFPRQEEALQGRAPGGRQGNQVVARWSGRVAAPGEHPGRRLQGPAPDLCPRPRMSRGGEPEETPRWGRS